MRCKKMRLLFPIYLIFNKVQIISNYSVSLISIVQDSRFTPLYATIIFNELIFNMVLIPHSPLQSQHSLAFRVS